MAIFETHFHFDADWDAEKYHEDAVANGVKFFLAVGGDEATTLDCQNFAGRFKNAWFSAGVHPHEASRYTKDISMFAKFANKPNCIAIGEIGLDYFYENSDRKSQLHVFEKFLELGKETNFPVIVHCRDKDGSELAYEDAYSLLSDFSNDGGKFVVHCYTGSVSWAEEFLGLGGYLGVTGIVTFPKAKNVRDVVKIIPDDRILLETDTPYLAPRPFRGKTNHSKYLPYIVTEVAREKGLNDEEVEDLTTENAFRLFQKAKR